MTRTGTKILKSAKKNMISQLLWAKENRTHHADTTIDYATLNQSPTDGSMFDELRGYEENAEEDTDGSNEPGPE